MKKILIVINNLNIGGIQKSLVNFLNEIVNYYDVYLIIFSGQGKLLIEVPPKVKIIHTIRLFQVLGLSQKEAKQKGLFIYFLRTFGAIWSKAFGNSMLINLLMKSYKIKYNFDYGISFSQFSPLCYFSGGTNEFIINCVNCREKVTFVHCDFENYGGNNSYTRNMYYKFDKIVTCSEGTRKQFLKVLPDLEKNTFVIHNINQCNRIVELSKKHTVIYDKTVLNLISIS